MDKPDKMVNKQDISNFSGDSVKGERLDNLFSKV